MLKELYLNLGFGRGARCQHGESGAAMVEAVIVLPVFLSVIFITMSISLFCYRLLSFQYAVSDITRQAFIYTKAERGNLSWQAFIESQANARAESIGLLTRISDGSNNYQVQFSSSDRGSCANWGCAETAEPGHIFAITVTVTEPLFKSVLQDISWQQISMSTKGIAFVQYGEAE
jgi:Flp pilus assembly protein TadG